MVENIDIDSVVKELSAEFDALIDERQEIRAKTEKLQVRADEIERKLTGIQKTLQGRRPGFIPWFFHELYLNP
jgi:hypothetical protein